MTLVFPSCEDRIEAWSNVYRREGHRWGFLPSLSAHLALAEIARLRARPVRLLDCGCGYGRDLLLFRSMFKEAILDGWDASSVATQLAQDRASTLRLRHHYGGNILNATDIPETAGYDCVFANYFVHLFCHDEAVEIMRLFGQLIAPGGIVVVSFVSTRDRHYGKGVKVARNCYEVRDGISWCFVDTSDVCELCKASDLSAVSMHEFSEVEFAAGRPDPVEGIWLVAKRRRA